MKKIICLVIVGLMILLTGCIGDETNPDKPKFIGAWTGTALEDGIQYDNIVLTYADGTFTFTADSGPAPESHREPVSFSGPWTLPSVSHIEMDFGQVQGQHMDITFSYVFSSVSVRPELKGCEQNVVFTSPHDGTWTFVKS